MNVFNEIQEENNLDSIQLDELINSSFEELQRKYPQHQLSYDEDGVWITNYIESDEDKESVEKILTNELLKIAEGKI